MKRILPTIPTALFEIWDRSPCFDPNDPRREFFGEDFTLEGVLKKITAAGSRKSEEGNIRVEGSYLTKAEIEKQIVDIAKFLTNLDDSHLSAESGLKGDVAFIKEHPRSEDLACFGANFILVLHERFLSGDFEDLSGFVLESLVQAEENFNSSSEDAELITQNLKYFRNLGDSILGRVYS